MTPKNEKAEAHDGVGSIDQTVELTDVPQEIHSKDQNTFGTAEKSMVMQTATIDDDALKQSTPGDDCIPKQTTPEDVVLLKQTTPDKDLPKQTGDDTSLKQTTLEKDASARQKTSIAFVDDAIRRISAIQISESSTDADDVGSQYNEDDESERENDSLTETLLESDGNSVGCESDLDSDGLSDDDHFRQRRCRSVDQGSGPERTRVASRRHQPYRTPSRSSQEDSLGSWGSVALPSPQTDEFLLNLVSGNPTGCEDSSQSGSFLQNDSSSDSDDVRQGVVNAFEAVDGGSLICDSYQTSIPVVVEEKEKEPDEPEKKPRRKRVPKKTNIQDNAELTAALQFIQDELAEGQEARQKTINVSTTSDNQPAPSCYTNTLDDNFALSTSSVQRQTTTYSSVSADSNVPTQQTMCQMPRDVHWINPITPTLNPGRTPISTHQPLPSSSFNPTYQTGPLTLPLPAFRLTTAGTMGVPSQQLLACTLLPLQPGPQSVFVNLPQTTNQCQTLPPGYFGGIPQPPNSIYSQVPTLLPKPT